MLTDRLFLQMALEQAPDAVLVTTVDIAPPGPLIVYANTAFARLTGYTLEEVVGRSADLLEGEDTQITIFEQIRRAVQGDEVSTWRTFNYRKGGTRFLAETSLAALRDSSGDVRYCMATLRDETDMWLVEEALRQNEHLLQHIADTLPAVLFMYNVGEGRLQYCSRESLAILGYLPKELTGADLSLHELLHPEDLPRMSTQMENLMRAPAGHMVEAECRVLHRTGDWKWLLLRTTVSERDPDGRATQLLGVAIDITESRRLGEQLTQASKLESLGRLAGGVAHDFNNLLTVIQSYAEMAGESLSGEHPARQYLDHILQASEQASNLTNQMLAFARRRIISPQVFNLNDLVEQTRAFLQRLLPENVTLVTALEPNLWHIDADPTQIEQVILNLAINARDAMPDGGVLTIETQNITLDDDYVSRHAEARSGEHVLLVVSDSGIGMDDRTLARVFEPFFTTKEVGKGTGLGLSTCYGIVKQAGGSIWVYSEPGRGTTFKVYLPRSLEQVVALPERREQKKPTGGNETILVVEDNDAVREVAVAALEAHGYQVLEAASAEEALALLDEFAGDLHLLLTDVVMPGMSGASLAAILRDRLPNVKVLYTSGYTENVIVHHGVLEENVAFLPKPYRPAELARRVREVLDST